VHRKLLRPCRRVSVGPRTWNHRPSQCGGKSQSFIEGREVYTNEPSRGADEDDDGNSIDQ
jgi:hypothetical protein